MTWLRCLKTNGWSGSGNSRNGAQASPYLAVFKAGRHSGCSFAHGKLVDFGKSAQFPGVRDSWSSIALDALSPKFLRLTNPVR